MKVALFCVIFSCLFLPEISLSQDNANSFDQIISFPNKFLSDINKKTTSLEGQLSGVSVAYLKKLSRHDAKLKKKLNKLDSAGTSKLYPDNLESQYTSYIQQLKSDTTTKNLKYSGIYYPNTDSLQMLLAYLKLNPQLLTKSHISTAQLESAVSKLSQLQGKLNYSDQINQFIAQRKQQFQQVLAKYTNLPNTIKNSYTKYTNQAAYYSDQIKSYKESLNDPDKMMNNALLILYKVPSFNQFVKSNSILSGLFSAPATMDSSKITQGLQTRKQIQSMLQEKMGPQGSMAFSKIQTSVQSAQGELDGLRDKLNASGSGDMNMPDFQGSNQRSKSFLHRIEYGANLQTTRNTYYFPITTDLAISAGYRLNKTNIIGIALAYKIGWGADIQHIHLSSQGMGLRSFVDIKMQKTFFLSGGLEYNYQQPFNPLHIFDNGLQDWTKSGLIGVSKIVVLKSKLLKKSKVQLLWDFLSYRQVPRTPAFVFRVGYSF